MQERRSVQVHLFRPEIADNRTRKNSPDWQALEIRPLRKAKLAAAPITNFSGAASLIKVRDKVVNALSDLIRALEEGQLTQKKIDKTKGAIQDWINRLKVL